MQVTRQKNIRDCRNFPLQLHHSLQRNLLTNGLVRSRTGVIRPAAQVQTSAGPAVDAPDTSTFQKAAPVTPLSPPSPTAAINTYYFSQKQLQYPAFADVIDAITVTVEGGAGGGTTKPAPVVVMFNAFLTTARCYLPLHRQLAAEGYAVVQYDIPYLKFLDASFLNKEVDVFPELLKWLELQNTSSSSSSKLRGRLDLDRVCVAGHSRGGKLATLNFCRHNKTLPGVKACYLIDPVDELGTKGVEALAKAKTLRIGVTGFCKTGALNPERSNFRHFAAAADLGSQLHELPLATHLQILDAGPALNSLLRAIDTICLLPLAEKAVTTLFDLLSHQPATTTEELAATLAQLMRREEFRALLPLLKKAADGAKIRSVSQVVELLMKGDPASVLTALGRLGRMQRTAAFVGRMPVREGAARVLLVADPTAVAVTSVTAAALKRWLDLQLGRQRQ